MQRYAVLLILLISLCLCLLATGCSSKEKIVPVVEIQKIIPCPRPSKPYELIPLRYAYLESFENAEIILKNRLITDEYIVALQGTILCYERQIAKQSNGKTVQNDF